MPRCVVSLLLLSACLAAAQSQDPPAPGTATEQQQADQEREREKKEQSQRFLGVVPMFSVTHQRALPLTSKQKFHLFVKSAVDPFVFFAVGFQAAITQATDGFHDYGQGAAGYGKRYGATLADQSSSNFFSTFLYPVLLKDDPRYFRMGEGPAKRRIWWALEQVLVGYNDRGNRTFSAPNVLGAVSTGGLSNAYYPPSDRGFGLTMSRAGISLLYLAAGNVFSEYWPEIQNKIHPKRSP